MAGIVKLDTDGVLNAPLGEKELGYSTVTEELYVGSGSGDSTFDSEYRVTRNKEVNNVSNATLPNSGYTRISKKLDNFVFDGDLI